MKRIITLAALVGLSGAAYAATSGTTVTSANPNLFAPAAIGFVSATITATGAPVLAALPNTTKTVNSLVCAVRDSSNNRKNLNTFISGTDIAVTTSSQDSSTVAIGDRINCVIVYER